jgi:hypothetical protein
MRLCWIILAAGAAAAARSNGVVAAPAEAAQNFGGSVVPTAPASAAGAMAGQRKVHKKKLTGASVFPFNPADELEEVKRWRRSDDDDDDEVGRYCASHLPSPSLIASVASMLSSWKASVWSWFGGRQRRAEDWPILTVGNSLSFPKFPLHTHYPINPIAFGVNPVNSPRRESVACTGPLL